MEILQCQQNCRRLPTYMYVPECVPYKTMLNTWIVLCEMYKELPQVTSKLQGFVIGLAL